MRGFSFIELILVITILSIMVGVSSPTVMNLVTRTRSNGLVQETLSLLSKAQLYSMDKKGGVSWGVCLIGGKIRFYSDTCIVPLQQIELTIPDGVSVAGLSDISFDWRGLPNLATSIQVTSDYGIKTIIVGSGGLIDKN